MKEQAQEIERVLQAQRRFTQRYSETPRRRWLSTETCAWLIGGLRASIIFAICFGIALLSRQYPKFYFHALFAIVAAAVFGGLAWLFRPRS